MFFAQTQLYSILPASFLLGVTFGIVWEILRLWRRIAPSPVAEFVRDFLFVMTVILGSRVFYGKLSYGQIRWFYVAAELAGMVLYHLLVGRFLYEPIYRLLCRLARLLRKIFSLILYPFKLAAMFAGKVWNILGNLAIAFLKKVFIFIKKYIIIKLYKPFRHEKNLKERNLKHGKEGSKEPEEGHISRFYH